MTEGDTFSKAHHFWYVKFRDCIQLFLFLSQLVYNEMTFWWLNNLLIFLLLFHCCVCFLLEDHPIHNSRNDPNILCISIMAGVSHLQNPWKSLYWLKLLEHVFGRSFCIPLRVSHSIIDSDWINKKIGRSQEVLKKTLENSPRWWFQIFFFHPENWGRWTHFDLRIFFRCVGSTTNQSHFEPQKMVLFGSDVSFPFPISNRPAFTSGWSNGFFSPEDSVILKHF